VKIVPQSAVLESITVNGDQLIERAGRTCYQSTWKMLPGGESAAKFIEMIWKRGHHSVIEHGYATIRFVCDRGVSHEAVRHRIAAFSQESTRFCNYLKEQFGGEITVIEPPFVDPRSRALWVEVVEHIERAYMTMTGEYKEKAEIARSILPNCLKTEIVMSADFREWLHFLHLRNAPGKAHPQMVEVAAIAEKLLVEACPAVFSLAARRRKIESTTARILDLVGLVVGQARGGFTPALEDLTRTYDEYMEAQ
jgi:thymidylate synthase (FAD)